MDFPKSFLFLSILLPAVLPALLPIVQSIEPFQNDEGLDLSSIPNSSLNATLSTFMNDTFSAKDLQYDTDIRCHVQPSLSHYQYHPIVSHNSQPIESPLCSHLFKSQEIHKLGRSSSPENNSLTQRAPGPRGLLSNRPRHHHFTRSHKAKDIHARCDVRAAKRQLHLSDAR